MIFVSLLTKNDSYIKIINNEVTICLIKNIFIGKKYIESSTVTKRELVIITSQKIAITTSVKIILKEIIA